MYNGGMEGNMTVGELREKLDGFGPEETVVVSVRVHTRRYSVCGVTPFEVEGGYGGCAIYISLPDNMHVVERARRPARAYTAEEETARRKAREREITNA